MGNYVSTYTGAMIDERLRITSINVSGSGTDTITATHSSTVALADGLRVTLLTAGENTTNSVTFNINTLGAKNVKVKRFDGTKVAVGAYQLPAIAELYYDGTDFLVLNAPELATYDDLFEMYEGNKYVTADNLGSVLLSRKRKNLLSDTLALCEDSTLFTNTTTTDSDNADNRKLGKYATKIVLTDTTGNIYYDILSLMNTSKYYFAVAEVKNGDLSGSGIRLNVNAVGDVTSNASAYVTATDYTRKGVVIKPTDFDGASAVRLTIELDGANTEFAYLDNLSVYEISKYEYQLGASTLLSQLPFESSEGQHTWEEIVSLNSYMSNGRLEAVLHGQSLNNLLSDTVAGCEATTGWSAGGVTHALDNTNKLEGTNCFKMTLLATSGGIYKDFLSKFDTSKYYLISSYVDAGDLSTDIRMYISLTGGAGDIYSTSITNSFWTRVGYVLQPSDMSAITNLYIGATCRGVATEIGYQDCIMVTEITAEDYNSVTSVSNPTELFTKYPFHLGLKGTEDKRIECVGKNLFNKETLSVGRTLDGSGNSIVSSTGSHSDYIEIFPSTQYTIQGRTQTTVAFYTEHKSYITASAGVQTFTTNANAKFLRFNTAIDDDANFIQLEEGSSATTYEPYKNSVVNTEVSLYSVPNGTNCTLNLNTGEHVQRVKSYALVAGDMDDYNTTPTNVDYVDIGSFADMATIPTSAGTYDKMTLVDGFRGLGYADSTDNEYTHTTSSAGKILLVVPKGTYANLAAAQADLAGTIIHYELAPASYTTSYVQEETLQAFTTGTLHKLNEVEEVLYYDGDLALESGVTPNAVTEVTLLDDDVETETPVDISTATIASSTSITLSGASTGEKYRIKYTYFGQGTSGELRFRPCTNLKEQVDGNSSDIIDLSKRVKQLAIHQKDAQLSHLGSVTASVDAPIFIAPYDCRIVAIKLVVGADISKSDTDYWDFTVTYGGNTLVSEDTTATSGVALTNYVVTNLGALDESYYELSKDDVLKLAITKTSAPTNLDETSLLVEYIRI